MGLSSSQARLLNLTSRMHQIEYKAAKLEAEKLQMANESDKVYEEYLEALDATKIQIKVLTTDGSITYKDFSEWQELADAGISLHVSSTMEEWSDDEDIECKSGTVNTTLNSKTLVNLLESGDFVLCERNNCTVATQKDGTAYTSVATSTKLQEVTDESGLKKAEAKYEADMKKIDRKDSKYDSDIAALETERTAISDEMDTLKTVAKDNVERTFKIFS